MMSSAIPARLQFQCGHAALVTLPRVKGESSAQRNQRIAHEKSAALLRQCDFCGPTIAIPAATRPDEVLGAHMTAADVAAAQPLVAAEPVEPVIVVAENEAAVIEAVFEDEPVVVVIEEPVLLVVEEPAVLVEPVVVVEAPVVVEARPKLVAKPVRRKPVVAHTNGVARAQRFRVEYQVERVLRAADIRDALRQAAALGAAEVLAITRED